MACSLLLALTFASIVRHKAPLPKTVEFNRDIRPILSETASPATGPTGTAQGGPAARHEDGLCAEGTVVPGKPDESELYKRLIETGVNDRRRAERRFRQDADRR